MGLSQEASVGPAQLQMLWKVNKSITTAKYHIKGQQSIGDYRSVTESKANALSLG